MDANLVILGGKEDGDKIAVSPHGKTTFGRSPSCDYQLLDQHISRTHFCIEAKARFFLLTDLQSSAGTMVNGKRVATKILHPNDKITAGPLEFVFKLMETERPEAPSKSATSKSTASRAEPASTIKFESNYDEKPFSLGGEGELVKPGEALHLLDHAKKALHTVYSVGNVIYTEESLDNVCHSIMDASMEVVQPDRGFLIMYHPDDRSLEPVVVRRRSAGGSVVPNGHRLLRVADEELDLCRPIVLHSVKRGVSIISDELHADTGDESAIHIKSAMCVPVRTNSDIIGAIYVDRVDSDTPFEPHHLELLAAIGRQAGVAIERARMLEDMEGLFYSCVRALVSSIEAKDQYTHGHSERVTAFAVTIAEEMGLDAETLDNVRLGALLHDVGKIGVAEKILTKPSRLTVDEVKIIREHPVRGAEILSHINNIPGVIAAVKYHHEMYNGLGYPDALAGEEIPLTARIVALADAFDAMTSNRNYRRNFDVDEAVSEFTRCSGDQFDPEVCDVMIKLLRDGRIIPCNELFAKGIDVSKSIY